MGQAGGDNFDARGGKPMGGPGRGSRAQGLPAGLSAADEAELLSLVEGEFGPELERRVLVRWQGRPEVIRLIEGMIGDRRRISGLPEIPAPTGLLDHVESLLEREALIGGEPGSEFSTAFEHGTLVSSRPPTVDIGGGWSFARVLRITGVAAGLALAAGATFLVMRGGGLPAPRVKPGLENTEAAKSDNRVAINQAPRDSTALVPPPAPSPTVPESSQRDAAGSQPAPGDATLAAMSKREESPALTMAAGDETAMSTERALELAREGRLMIRVVTGSVDQTLAKVRAGNDRRLADVVTGVHTSPRDVERIAFVAESIRPLAGRFDAHAARSFESRGGAEVVHAMSAQDVISRDRQAQVLELVRPEFSSLSSRRQTARAVARVDLEADGRAIESFQKALAAKGGVVVELVELPEPVTGEETFDPDDVLWWTQPPSTWAPKVAVPVVFEVP